MHHGEIFLRQFTNGQIFHGCRILVLLRRAAAHGDHALIHIVAGDLAADEAGKTRHDHQRHKKFVPPGDLRNQKDPGHRRVHHTRQNAPHPHSDKVLLADLLPARKRSHTDQSRRKKSEKRPHKHGWCKNPAIAPAFHAHRRDRRFQQDQKADQSKKDPLVFKEKRRRTAVKNMVLRAVQQIVHKAIPFPAQHGKDEKHHVKDQSAEQTFHPDIFQRLKPFGNTAGRLDHKGRNDAGK